MAEIGEIKATKNENIPNRLAKLSSNLLKLCL